MVVLTEVAKFLGVALATTVAILATYLDGTKSIESGRLTRKGRLLVASALLGLIISVTGQVTQLVNSLAAAESIRARNEETASRLERIPPLILRSAFPLEPVEFLYTIEYRMDQPALHEYAERLRAAIVRRLNLEPNDTLASYPAYAFGVTGFDGGMPDGQAARILLDDDTGFTFRAGPLRDHREIVFGAEEPLPGITTMKRHGDYSLHCDTEADFRRRVFIKSVRCTNPTRAGTDITAYSALDLVDRKLTWSFWRPLDETLTAFGMRFSYDIGFGQDVENLRPERHITIAKGRLSATITSSHAGLQGILPERK